MKTPLGPTFSGFSEPPSQLGLSQFQQSPFSKNPPPPSPSYPVPLRNFPSTDTLTLRAGCESPALFAVFRTEVSLPYCSSSNKTCLAVFNKHQVQNFSPTQMRESSGWNHQKAQIPTPRASGGVVYPCSFAGKAQACGRGSAWNIPAVGKISKGLTRGQAAKS